MNERQEQMIFDEGYRRGKADRPRGKWHHIQSVCYGGGTMNEVVCSKCHEHQILPTNFCPYCGADMRQTENEDEKL